MINQERRERLRQTVLDAIVADVGDPRKHPGLQELAGDVFDEVMELVDSINRIADAVEEIGHTMPGAPVPALVPVDEPVRAR